MEKSSQFNVKTFAELSQSQKAMALKVRPSAINKTKFAVYTDGRVTVLPWQ